MHSRSYQVVVVSQSCIHANSQLYPCTPTYVYVGVVLGLRLPRLLLGMIVTALSVPKFPRNGVRNTVVYIYRYMLDVFTRTHSGNGKISRWWWWGEDFELGSATTAAASSVYYELFMLHYLPVNLIYINVDVCSSFPLTVLLLFLQRLNKTLRVGFLSFPVLVLKASLFHILFCVSGNIF